MLVVTLSKKGQITIPAAIRRQLGLKPGSRIEVEVREGEIILKPIKSIMELAGVFHEYAVGKSADWETQREEMYKAVADAVLGEDGE